MKIISFIKSLIESYKRRQALKKRIAELRKRDPFIYK